MCELNIDGFFFIYTKSNVKIIKINLNELFFFLIESFQIILLNSFLESCLDECNNTENKNKKSFLTNELKFVLLVGWYIRISSKRWIKLRIKIQLI